MNNIAVQAIDLCRQFGHFMAVDHINFEVYQGEIFGFLGANGAGKTTTIRMLTGLLMPTAGEGRVNGFNISNDVEKIKRTIGYMSQKFSLYQDLTVEENIEFYGGIYGLSPQQIHDRTDWVLDKLNLQAQRRTLVSDIPLGWKQKLALGTAVLHNPPILFLDEPTSGVDPVSRREFWMLINELARNNTTVFVTTHYMDEAEYCNRLSIMHSGKIIALDSPTNLKQTYKKTSIEDVFVSLVDK
ncbi:ABC transporter ATP-binding protein [candidate division KSB1 bacterium]|nr:ABC transporter ATP-binding protein [candidate division KSB1 bacterium]